MMMMSLKMGSVSLDQQNNHGIMDEQNQDSLSSNSSEISSNFSSEEEGNSSNSPTGPVQNMSSLLQELPFKRGLSKHYNGKSQSFTSLSKVMSLEDLAKPENPYNKKLKSCKSYAVFLEGFKDLGPPKRSNSSSRLGSKKTTTTRGSFSSLRARRNGSFNRPLPVPSHTSTNDASFTNQTPLFA